MKYALFTISFILFAAMFITPSYANTTTLIASIQFAQGQSLNEAVQSIKQQTGGRILSTKTVQKNGQTVYKIKVLLPSGKVQTFTVNAS